MIRRGFVVGIVAIGLLVGFCGCGGPEHVSAADFQAQYAWVGQPQSMKAVTYLGQHDGRAYIRVSTMSTVSQKWSDRVVYVELSELDPAFRATLPATQMSGAK